MDFKAHAKVIAKAVDRITEAHKAGTGVARAENDFWELIRQLKYYAEEDNK